MANKVDWITWKTDAKEIINPDTVTENINSLFEEYNTYMHPVVYEQIKYEMEQGGLSREAFNVSGVSPAYEVAKGIIERIEEIKEIIDSLKRNIDSSLVEQKRIEKDQLVNELLKSLDKEKMILASVQESRRIKSHIYNMGENPEDIIDIVNDRIRKLNERLEIARNL